jgi:hypothetical protein
VYLENGLFGTLLELLPLSRAFPLALLGRIERPISKFRRIRSVFDEYLVPIELAGYVLVL